MTIAQALRSSARASISQSADPSAALTDGLEPSLYSIKVQMREGIMDLGTITREIRIE